MGIYYDNHNLVVISFPAVILQDATLPQTDSPEATSDTPSDTGSPGLSVSYTSKEPVSTAISHNLTGAPTESGTTEQYTTSQAGTTPIVVPVTVRFLY